MCVHLLTNTTKSEMQQADPYIRLLGMSKTGQAYLKQLRKSCPFLLYPLYRNVN